MQTAQYLYSEETLYKTQQYLEKLRKSHAAAGYYLNEMLNRRAITSFNTISAEQLIVHLMNTRKPQIFAEDEVRLDGSDWNEEESSILGDIVFSTTKTHAYNNGHHTNHKAHETPINTNFIFVAGALLRNSYGNQTSDMKEIIVSSAFNEDAFYKLYERRLLPGLLMQNKGAQRDKIELVINIPGIGCGQFAGNYEDQVRSALPRVLRRFFETHADKLHMIHTVNYDPYIELAKDEFTHTIQSKHTIRLMARPLCGLPDGATGKVASQLEYPKDGTDYSRLRLIKIVAWDHFSWPGNDIWQNVALIGNGRNTDDGVTFASSDVILSMLHMGQFGNIKLNYDESFRYDQKQGIFYLIDQDNKILGYQELSQKHHSLVTEHRISCVATMTFLEKKSKIQEQCIASLNTMLNKIGISDDLLKVYESLHDELTNFFAELNDQTTQEELQQKITDFRNAFKEHIQVADKIMGHGWLYRICEVLIKAVVGLFASIGMVIGSFVGQGLVNQEHCKKFTSTFFTLDKNNASQALEEFKQNILGNENDSYSPGLIAANC